MIEESAKANVIAARNLMLLHGRDTFQALRAASYGIAYDIRATSKSLRVVCILGLGTRQAAPQAVANLTPRLLDVVAMLLLQVCG